MNLDGFIEFLQRYGRISAEAEADLRSRVRLLSRNKGQTIIRMEQTESSFFYIEKGMVRSYFKHGNRQVTIWFAVEGQVAASTSSQFQNQPSYETVECIEDCEFLYIPNHELEELYRKYDCMNTIGRKMAEELYCDMNARIYYLQVLSSRERLQELTKWEPEVVNRAPL